MRNKFILLNIAGWTQEGDGRGFTRKEEEGEDHHKKSQ